MKKSLRDILNLEEADAGIKNTGEPVSTTQIEGPAAPEPDEDDTKYDSLTQLDMVQESLDDIIHTLRYGEDTEKNFGKDIGLINAIEELYQSINDLYEYIEEAYGILPYVDPDMEIEIPEEVVNEELEKNDDDPCWKGYVKLGTKKKNGKEVPNCVPVK